MPVLNTQFQLTALRPNGTGVAGAQIRVLSSAGVDVTAQLFGTSQLITDSLGVWTGRETGSSGDLLYTNATIQVIAPYYETWSMSYPFAVIGIAHLTANLVRVSSSDDYTITAPSVSFVSSMAPILFTVQSASTFPWENIVARIEKLDGTVSIIEAPVDRVTHRATLDIRNRINLGARPFLVKEPDVSRPDMDFSDKVTVTISSLTEEGETAIDAEGFELYVAATLPRDGETDLAAYVSRDHQPWLVPSLPVYANRGHYRDVMIWLPVPSLPGYVLTTTYYNGAGTVVSTTTDNLVESPYVQRIRINTDPVVNVVRSVLSIKSGTTVITQPLTVLYRD